MAARKEIELIPISSKFVKTGGYLARIKDRYTLEYDEVLDEVVEESGLRLNRDNLRLILDSTFNTIIRNTLRDGNCRRVGNYFTLQLEVNGKFDGPGDQFDPEKHRLSLVLRPLKELRREPKRGDCRVYNRNAGPLVVLDGMHSVSTPESEYLAFGEDIVVEGENLTMLEDETLHFVYAHQDGHTASDLVPAEAISVNPSGTRITVNWEKAFDGTQVNEGDAQLHAPIGLMFGLRSRGGIATAKVQLHRVKALFLSWHRRYPKYKVSDHIWPKV